MNQNWVRKSILACPWTNFYLVFWMRRNSNPQPLDHESNTLDQLLIILKNRMSRKWLYLVVRISWGSFRKSFEESLPQFFLHFSAQSTIQQGQQISGLLVGKATQSTDRVAARLPISKALLGCLQWIPSQFYSKSLSSHTRWTVVQLWWWIQLQCPLPVTKNTLLVKICFSVFSVFLCIGVCRLFSRWGDKTYLLPKKHKKRC